MLPRMIRYVAICVGTAAALLISGCTSSISGTPTAAAGTGATGTTGTTNAPSHKPSHSTSSGHAPDAQHGARPLGAIDPCSLLSTDAFDSLGRNGKGTVGFAGYSECTFTVSATPVGSGQKFWSVTLSADSYFPNPDALRAVYETAFTEKTVQGAPVLEGTSPINGCMRATPLGQNVTLLVSSKSPSNNNPCTAADAALSSALKNIAAHSERQLKLPAGTLASANLCTTFGAAAAELLGSTPTASQRGLHGCEYVAGTNSIVLSLESASWPPDAPLPNGTTSKIHGKSVLQSVLSASGSTLAQADINVAPAAVGGKGSVDELAVFAETRGGDGAAFKHKFEAFLAALCSTRLR